MIRPRARGLALVAALLLFSPAAADEGKPELFPETTTPERDPLAVPEGELEPPRPTHRPAAITWPPSFELGGGVSIQPMPLTDLYPRYVADPRRPRFAFMWLRAQKGLRVAGLTRLDIMFGGRYGVLRLHPTDDPDLGFQVDIEAGVKMQFDTTHKLDGSGWDGFYGLGFSWKPLHSLAFRLSVNHDSSHVVDELIARTSWERINYTREEFALGVSWQPLDGVRLYAEAGIPYSYGNSQVQDRWRVQWGAEWESPPLFWGDIGRLYAAVDMVSFEENAWQTSATVQAGACLRWDSIGRAIHAGVQYYDGRNHFGEFFRYRERYVGIGAWLDL